jgi:hypothetical protein
MGRTQKLTCLALVLTAAILVSICVIVQILPWWECKPTEIKFGQVKLVRARLLDVPAMEQQQTNFVTLPERYRDVICEIVRRSFGTGRHGSELRYLSCEIAITDENDKTLSVTVLSERCKSPLHFLGPDGCVHGRDGGYHSLVEGGDSFVDEAAVISGMVGALHKADDSDADRCHDVLCKSVYGLRKK